MKATQIIGIVFLIALITSLAYKMNESLSHIENSSLVVFLILAVGLILLMGIRRVLRS